MNRINEKILNYDNNNNYYHHQGVNMNFEHLFRKMDGRRTRLVYEDTYAGMVFTFYNLLPYFSKLKELYVVNYSETACRRMGEIYRSLKKDNPELAEIFGRMKIIKVGNREHTSYGELHQFINAGDVREELKTLGDVISTLPKNAFLMLRGLYLVPAIYGKAILGDVMRLFDAIPDGITLVEYYSEGILGERLNRIVEKFFDIIIGIRKDDAIFGDNNFILSIEQSIIQGLEPRSWRVRIGYGGIIDPTL